jgi:hypothetical protein
MKVKPSSPKVLYFAHQNSPEYSIKVQKNNPQILEFSIKDSPRSPIISPVPCRICLQITNEPLISPCHCKGTLSFIHSSCLKSWLLTNDQIPSICELCKSPYQISLSYKLKCRLSAKIWIPLLLISLMVFGILLSMIFFIVDSSIEDPFIFGILAFFSVIGVILAVFSVFLVTSQCFYKEIKDLSTLDQTTN